MKLEQSFEVDAPIDRVWSTLIDIERVAPCLPGAAVTGRNDNGSYNGTLKIKIGPTSASYIGKLEMDDLQQDAHTATMHAAGTDKRGQGGAKASIKSKLTALGDGTTRVEVNTDYHITGRLARFGRGGMIEDIAERLLRDFTECLQTSLLGAPGTSAVAETGAGAGAGDAAASGDEGVAAPSPAAAAPDPAEPGANGGEAPAGGQEEAAAAPPTAAAALSAAVSSSATADAGDPSVGDPSVGDPSVGGAAQPVRSSEALDALALVRSVLWDRAKGNPTPFAFVVGLLLALLAFKRARRRRSA
jgi:carbon monoxide dehydrogenase subunit G